MEKIKSKRIVPGLSLILAMMMITISCSRVPLTGRRQINLLPENMLVGMALTSYQEFLTENPPLPANDPRQRMIQSLGKRISTAVNQYMIDNGMESRVENFQWEFNVVQNEAVNAWCMPGGKVVFYTGILPITQDEIGAAVVMSHEIAHAVARHGNERMSQQIALVLGAVSLDVALSEQPDATRDIFMMAYGVGGTLGTLAYSRRHELEADRLGMIFMAMAGYDPTAAIGFWQRMAEHSKGAAPPELVSTHPSDERRIRQVKKHLPEALEYYNP
jgi:predicted Zn-dependent protease